MNSAQALPLDLEAIEAEAQKMTFGQRVADAMASKVGSWGFLIGQSVVLTGWIGMNLMPGVPHWDSSPFILLNLVFSFASAYTAPVVLMSQNRQSDEERKKSEYDRLVNQKASYNIELLHEKLDTLHAQQLQEMTQIIKIQQQQIDEMKVMVAPVLKAPSKFFDETQVSETKVAELSNLQQQPDFNGIKLVGSNFLNQYPVYVPLNISQPIESDSKVIEGIYVSLNH
jgi:uncharacterized membrane protein